MSVICILQMLVILTQYKCIFSINNEDTTSLLKLFNISNGIFKNHSFIKQEDLVRYITDVKTKEGNQLKNLGYKFNSFSKGIFENEKISCRYCLEKEISFKDNYVFGIVLLDNINGTGMLFSHIKKVIDDINFETGFKFSVRFYANASNIRINVPDYIILLSNSTCFFQKNKRTLPPYLIVINPDKCGSRYMITSMLLFTFGANYFHQSMYRDYYFKIYWANIVNKYIDFYFKIKYFYVILDDPNSIMVPDGDQYAYYGYKAITFKNETLLPVKNDTKLFTELDLTALRCMSSTFIP